MNYINIKGLTPSAVVSVIVLLVALLNAVLQIFGINTIPITSDVISEMVSIVFLIVTALYNTYKNFNISSASQTAQEITDAIKNGEVLVSDVKKVVSDIKESR